MNANPPTAGREAEFLIPIGFTDDDGRVHRSAVLRKMTGREEAILADKRNQRNGGKLVTELIASCLIRLGEIPKSGAAIVERMYSADRNFLLLKLRTLTFGPELQASYSCASCGDSIQVLEDLDQLPVKMLQDGDSPDEIAVKLEDGYADKDGLLHTALILRLPRGEDEAAVAPQMRQNPSLGKNALLARCLRSLGDVPRHRLEALGPKILADLTLTDRRLIDRALNSNAPGIDLVREVACGSCGSSFRATLDMTNFLALA